MINQSSGFNFAIALRSKDISKNFVLTRDVLSRVCRSDFRYTVLTTVFISVLSFKHGSGKAPALTYVLLV